MNAITHIANKALEIKKRVDKLQLVDGAGDWRPFVSELAELVHDLATEVRCVDIRSLRNAARIGGRP